MCFPSFMVPTSAHNLNLAKNVNPGLSGQRRKAATLLRTCPPSPSHDLRVGSPAREQSLVAAPGQTINNEFKEAPAGAGCCLGGVRGSGSKGSRAERTASRPPAGQGQARPRLAAREASETSAGLYLPEASATCGEKR